MRNSQLVFFCVLCLIPVHYSFVLALFHVVCSILVQKALVAAHLANMEHFLEIVAVLALRVPIGVALSAHLVQYNVTTTACSLIAPAGVFVLLKTMEIFVMSQLQFDVSNST
jgi:hypothetical protein